MKRPLVLAAAVLLSASLLAPAHAAQAAKGGTPKQSQGIINAKKVMKARFDREKKMTEVRKQALAKKRQAKGK